MRTLEERPLTIVDPGTGLVNAGSYRGGIPLVDPAPLGEGRLFRVAHEKRWVYAAVAAEDLFIGAAMVRLGYAANAFAFAYDRAAGRMAADFSVTVPPFAVQVGNTAGHGCTARLRWAGSTISFERGPGERDYRFEVATRTLRVSARLGTGEMSGQPTPDGVPPPIGAVAAFPGPPANLFNATEKRVLLPVVGEAIAGGKHHALDGALGGFDFTFGFLPRRTAWRWAFALGRTRRAERVAFNLTQGFVGAAECAVWVDGVLHPVSEPVITYDEKNPLSPWQVRTPDGHIDLCFEPGAVHAEEHDFKVLASRFLQPAGSFSGTIRLAGCAPLELDRVLGVVEDQAVVW